MDFFQEILPICLESALFTFFLWWYSSRTTPTWFEAGEQCWHDLNDFAVIASVVLGAVVSGFGNFSALPVVVPAMFVFCTILATDLWYRQASRYTINLLTVLCLVAMAPKMADAYVMVPLIVAFFAALITFFLPGFGASDTRVLLSAVVMVLGFASTNVAIFGVGLLVGAIVMAVTVRSTKMVPMSPAILGAALFAMA